MSFEFLLPLLFFVIAFCYSSVGFGGGSSYLAILTFLSIPYLEIRTTALLLNIAVVGIGTIKFARSGQIQIKQVLPFLIASVPFSFIGAQFRLSETSFFLILGFALLCAGSLLIRKSLFDSAQHKKFTQIQAYGIGSGIGLLAGLSGIGGGIYLSPTLHLLRWKTAKQIAAISSLFILVNSIAGLGGLLISNQFQLQPMQFLPLCIAVILGGLLGSFLTNTRFSSKLIGLLTAILILYVGNRILLNLLFDIQI